MARRRTLRGARLTSNTEASIGSNASRDVLAADSETQLPKSLTEGVPPNPTGT